MNQAQDQLVTEFTNKLTEYLLGQNPMYCEAVLRAVYQHKTQIYSVINGLISTIESSIKNA